MIKSMTGFGRGQASVEGGAWTVEMRTVNSRFLDLHLKIPAQAAALEERIKRHLSQHLSRGRVSMFVACSAPLTGAPRLILNLPLVREYRRVLDELRAELGLTDQPGLGAFLGNRDLIQGLEEPPDLDAVWQQMVPALDEALAQCQAMRLEEGQALATDLIARVDRLRDLFTQAASRAPEIVANYRQKLQDKLARLMEPGEIDPQRLAQEVAIMADKCDVTEEAVRAESHLNQLSTLLEADEPVGRKLDFLLQELNREANTMGSKSPDAAAGQVVVEIKAELERVREQVQNIE